MFADLLTFGFSLSAMVITLPLKIIKPISGKPKRKRRTRRLFLVTATRIEQIWQEMFLFQAFSGLGESERVRVIASQYLL